MEFDRHDRVRSLLLELVAAFIRNEASTHPLITVTGISISPDYKNVTARITTIPNTGENDALIFLKRKGKDLRTYIKRHSSMKIIPFIQFEIDYGERHRQHIDEVVQKIERGETKA